MDVKTCIINLERTSQEKFHLVWVGNVGVSQREDLLLVCYVFPGLVARLGSGKEYLEIFQGLCPDSDGPDAGWLYLCVPSVPRTTSITQRNFFLLPYIRSLIWDKICHRLHQPVYTSQGQDTAVEYLLVFSHIELRSYSTFSSYTPQILAPRRLYIPSHHTIGPPACFVLLWRKCFAVKT